MLAMALGLCVVLTALLGSGTASAASLQLVQGGGAGSSLGVLNARTASESGPGGGGCVINSLPSFMDQGEFDHSSSIADIVEVECEPVFAEHTVRLSSQELFSRCQHHLSWSLPYPYSPQAGSGFTVELDNDGNATAVISGGPGCAAGESLVSAHMEQAPFTTVTTAFTVLAPRPTPPGVIASPKEEVESETTSSVATVIQVEFPAVFAEAYVNIDAAQLFARCHVRPRLVWVGEGGAKISEGTESLSGVQLDNDGNAFVVLVGGGSCASGTSEIEASLEDAPYTTYTTTFTILPPQPTLPVEPGFTIEKLQRIGGEGSFTKEELTGELGDVVEYQIVVTNTGNVPLEFSHFSDPHCEGIAGGPGGKPVQPGGSTTFTCSHTLTSVGTWTNVASIVGNEGTGGKESNEVVVKVIPPAKPGFAIEKLQRIGGTGPFTTEELTGEVGDVVEYEIIVTNTGDVPLEFSNFSDPHCEGISGGPGGKPVQPGASTTFTCSHVLMSAGTWTNVATIIGNEGTGSKESNEVVVKVPPPTRPAYTIEKLQRIGGTGPFTKEELSGEVGDVVEYQIIVRNTGDVPLKFTNFTDPNCEGISGGPGSSAVPVGGSTTFTCTHTLTSPGTWTNVATIEGNEGTGAKESNEVVVKVPEPPVSPAPGITIEKLQRIGGTGPFTKEELTGKPGQVVEYQIIVKNTGNVPLTLSTPTDPGCTGLAGGASELAPGASTTFTCSFTLTAEGHTNVATIVGTPPPGQGAPVGQESNKVVVKVAPAGGVISEKEQAKCAAFAGAFVLKGAAGPKHNKFTVTVTAKGIKTITFYLDGRKVKTLKAPHGKNFSVKINPGKLKFGPHKISATAVLADPACGTLKRVTIFIHPKRGIPHFTG
jgi:uncharacterized repeat protein (TIGR01451 family)